MLKRLQSLSDLDPQRLRKRGFDPFLYRLQTCACPIELILELLHAACAQLTQNDLQRAIHLAACAAYCVAGHLRQAFIKAGFESPSRFVERSHAAVKVSDLLL